MGYMFSEFSTFFVSKINLSNVPHFVFLVQFSKSRIIAEWSFILGKAVCSVKLYYQYFFAIRFKPFPMGVSSITFSVCFSIPRFFLFSQSAAFFVKHCQDVFLVCFFLHFLNFFEPKCHCYHWYFQFMTPFLANFASHCCNKVSSQIEFKTNVEFFLPFFNCSQLCFILFYSETRKRLTTKNNEDKMFYIWNLKKTK